MEQDLLDATEAEQERYWRRREHLATTLIAMGSASIACALAAASVSSTGQSATSGAWDVYRIMTGVCLALAAVVLAIMYRQYTRAVAKWGDKSTWIVDPMDLISRGRKSARLRESASYAHTNELG